MEHKDTKAEAAAKDKEAEHHVSYSEEHKAPVHPVVAPSHDLLAEKAKALAMSAAGEVVTGYKLYKNEPSFVIGVRRQENLNLPVDSPKVVNWRIRVQNGIAVAIDDLDSDGVTDIEVYGERPFVP